MVIDRSAYVGSSQIADLNGGPKYTIAMMSERSPSPRAIPTIIANNMTKATAGMRITTLYRRPSAIPARNAGNANSNVIAL